MNLQCNKRILLPSIESVERMQFTASQAKMIEQLAAHCVCVTPETAQMQLSRLKDEHSADELMLLTHCQNLDDRTKSFRTIAESVLEHRWVISCALVVVLFDRI